MEEFEPRKLFKLTVQKHAVKQRCVELEEDISIVDGFVRGHPKAPCKRIKRALKRFATVIEVDEFRTSCTCSHCKIGKQNADDHKVEKATLLSTKPNQDGEYELVSCYNVLRCLNPGCNRFWQRDVNASRNIMEAFKCQIQGLPRPPYLERETSTAAVAPQTQVITLGIPPT